MTSISARGERRFVVLLDADMLGSAQFDAELGAEEAAEPKLAFRMIAREEIERHGGTYRTHGDEVFAEFGLTRQTEWPVLAAVRAGLAIVRRLEDGAEPLLEGLRVRPRVRIGIHCGLTWVQPDERGVVDFFGPTPDVVARIQASAGANEVWVSEDAYAGIRRFIDAVSLPPITAKGFADPIAVYRVEGDQEPVDRPLRREDSFALVGRDRERATLEAVAADWRNGARERVVIEISGEAGVGKTTLLADFGACLRARGTGVVAARCDPLARGKALSPLIDALNRLPAPAISDRDTIERTEAQILERLRELSGETGGLALVIDDVQFADPATNDLLGKVADGEAGRILLVVGRRTGESEAGTSGANGFVAESGPRFHVTLHRLDDASSLAVVHAATGGRELGADEAERIVELASGLPLYLHELAVAARSEAAPDWRERTSIPAGLWPAIEARLAMDMTAQEALRMLSLFAGALPLPAALAVGGMAAREALGRLTAHGLVAVQMDSQSGHCSIRHELIRRAVYERISARLRPRLHREAARALLEEVPDFAAGHPHIVASQLALGGETTAAAEHYFRAGGLAQERGAYATAEQHLAEAFGLAGPDLSLFQRVGQALVRIQMMTKGFSHESVRDTLSRLAAGAPPGGP